MISLKDMATFLEQADDSGYNRRCMLGLHRKAGIL